MKTSLIHRLQGALEAPAVWILTQAARQLLRGDAQERLATGLLDTMPIVWTIWYPEDVRRIAEDILNGEGRTAIDEATCLALLRAEALGGSLTEEALRSSILYYLDNPGWADELRGRLASIDCI